MTRAVKASSTGDIREAFGEEIVDEDGCIAATKGPSERPACGCKQLISARMARTLPQWSRASAKGASLYSATRARSNDDGILRKRARLTTYYATLVRLACQEGIAEDRKATRILFAACSGKRIDWRTDPNLLESDFVQQILPGCTRQTTGNSSRPEIDIGRRGRGHRRAVGDVGKL